MKTGNNPKWIAIMLLAASALFFVMGFNYPLLETGFGIGPIILKRDHIYLFTSFRYFFDQGEVFIGFLLLFFTVIFPILKYIFIAITLSGRRLPRHHYVSVLLDIINKWAMLDVFVVAVLILNMKFDSDIIVSKLQVGTTLFAISVVLLMISSYVTKKMMDDN
jgi:uncharacterized paraquat-inducible protein A